ncbi:MAG: DNA polymerase Y family protein, partial [Sphingomonadaceae bacterium]|nr:DNA polymerase Y family protein [Sphingomonadaceae bacterium]
ATAIDPPDAVLLDITGCAHLLGGEAAMIAAIEEGFDRLHLRCALASTPEAALALARHAVIHVQDEAEAVRRLPVAALRLDSAVETALRRAGLVTIGDLADRPTAPLGARFGDAAALALDRLLGRIDSRITPRRAPPALIVERRFAEPLIQTEAALAVLGELTGEAAVEMEGRGRGGRRFAARFFRSDGVVRALAVETGLPVRAPEAVMPLFPVRIDALNDPIDPGFGFDMIRLAVPVLEPLAAAQLSWDGEADDAEALAALVDRLSARLGRDRVQRFAPQDSHIPEQAWRTFPATQAPVALPWIDPMPGEPPLRPLHLFDPPQPIAVIAEVPEGPPRRFHWRRTVHDVTHYEGPERIAAPWWQQGAVAGLTRDYYRVEDAQGHRFWIFRHGLYGTERATPAWYVHGLFA